MQEEVNEKTIALSVRTARMTASVLKAAMRQFLLQQEKAKQKRNAKAAQKSVGKETPTRGKQTMKQLMEQNSQLTNIEVTDGNIKSFERVARKYQIDFSLKKDASVTPPKYIVFFKAKDVDVMTAAFKEFSAKELKKRISRPCGNVWRKRWMRFAITVTGIAGETGTGGRADEVRYKEVFNAQFPLSDYLLPGRKVGMAVPALCRGFRGR